MRIPMVSAIVMATLFLLPAVGAVVPVVGPAPVSGCGAAAEGVGCAGWTRISQGLDLCGVSGTFVITNDDEWAAFLEMGGVCVPEEWYTAVDFSSQWVAFVGIPHIDCCDHSTTIVNVLAGPEGYAIDYVHVTGWGFWDALTAPYDLISVDRVPTVPVEATFSGVDFKLPPPPPL